MVRSGCTWSTWIPASFPPPTYPFHLSQQPAATVPCGFTRSGLPVALQRVGDEFCDAKVLRATRAYETTHPFVMPDPGVVRTMEQMMASKSR